MKSAQSACESRLNQLLTDAEVQECFLFGKEETNSHFEAKGASDLEEVFFCNVSAHAL